MNLTFGLLLQILTNSVQLLLNGLGLGLLMPLPLNFRQTPFVLIATLAVPLGLLVQALSHGHLPHGEFPPQRLWVSYKVSFLQQAQLSTLPLP